MCSRSCPSQTNRKKNVEGEQPRNIVSVPLSSTESQMVVNVDDDILEASRPNDSLALELWH